DGGGGGVRIDVEPTAFVLREAGDDRHDAGGAEVGDEGGIDAGDLTDPAEVEEGAAGCGRWQQAAASEQALQRIGVQTDGPAAEVAHLANDARVDLVQQDTN